MTVGKNIKNTLSVDILHFLNPKCLWKFSNCVNQSLDQRLKKRRKKAGGLGSKARISSPIRGPWLSPHRCCRGHLCHLTTSCPGPSESLSPHLIHPACWTLFSLLVGMGTWWLSGMELWMEESFPRVGSGPLVQGKVSPSNQEGDFINSYFCSLSMSLVPAIPANRFVLAQCISASRGKVFPGFFSCWGQDWYSWH